MRRCRLTKWLKVIFTAIIVLYFVTNLFCVDTFKEPINKLFIATILGTNFNETAEFLDTFVTGNVIMMLAVSVVGGIVIVWLSKKIKLNKRMSCFCFILVLGCLAPCSRNTGVWDDTFIGHLSMICESFNYYSKIHDLREYYTSPAITETRDTHPKNVVLIIGESFSKAFSSLYGYEKETSPKLMAMRDSASLYVYDNVTAPALNTIKAFEHFMSTWRGQTGDNKEWYNYTTMPEVISLSNYTSYWISNQSKTGLFDNEVGKIADLCNYNMFVGNKFSGMNRANVDEDVLPLIKYVQNNMARNNRHNFYYIHLMGSHDSFENRFPANRNHFKASDYIKYPEKQRENRAAYDNSILYNDSVVSEIIKRFNADEAVIVYFSDHALDVFQSADDYCAHANAQIPASKAAGEAIPFMVYVTKKYRQAYPDVTDRIRQSVHKKSSTDNLIYTVMDIIGVKFAANNDVERFSLFMPGR